VARSAVRLQDKATHVEAIVGERFAERQCERVPHVVSTLVPRSNAGGGRHRDGQRAVDTACAGLWRRRCDLSHEHTDESRLPGKSVEGAASAIGLAVGSSGVAVASRFETAAIQLAIGC
jgi:hypothetical protein